MRTAPLLVLFALIAILVTTASLAFVYQRARSALESEFVDGLERVTWTTASQIAPEQIAEVRQARDESVEHGLIQLQLAALRSAAGVLRAVVIDTSRIVLVDDLSAELGEGLVTPLDSVAGSALRAAFAGDTTVSPVYRREGAMRRAGFAPVRSGGDSVAAVVAVEVEADYVPVLAALGRALAAAAALSAVAIALLALLVSRATLSASRLERRLSRAENLAAMGRMTATLAHEIKNPLAIIRGSAERLRTLQPEAQRMADSVIEESDRLSRTVARYLQFARGREDPDAAADAGDALEALQATLDFLEGELSQRRVTLERRRAAAGRAPVALDNESLKQVYLNLILNALEAMPEGGRLSIAETDAGGRIEVSITDDGAGMPPEVLDRLGDPFFTTKTRGSGLGLFLTRRLVRSAGGELLIRSEPGRGTACTLRIPRRKG
jgi:signal transduction histidine kinase